MPGVKTVSDVIPEGEGGGFDDLPDNKLKMADIKDEQVFLMKVEGPLNGEFGEYVIVIFDRSNAKKEGDDKEGFVFCSSKLCCKKLLKLRDEDHLPLYGTFTMKDNAKHPDRPYWDLV